MLRAQQKACQADVWPTSGITTRSRRVLGRNSRPSYYRARYYDPNSGRFLSEDLIGNDTGLNLYVYVHNRPAILRDPRGLYNLAGFLPEQQKQMNDAIDSAIQQLKKDCPSCAGDAAPKIIKALQTATYVYWPGLKDDYGSELCASAKPLASKTIRVNDIALKGKCCRLDSTLAHEAMHKALQSSDEPLMRHMEDKCFGCKSGF